MLFVAFKVNIGTRTWSVYTTQSLWNSLHGSISSAGNNIVLSRFIFLTEQSVFVHLFTTFINVF